MDLTDPDQIPYGHCNFYDAIVEFDVWGVAPSRVALKRAHAFMCLANF